MSKMQRDKGANFERWVAGEFRKAGFADARRGLAQTRDGGEVPDVDGTPFWIECKHHARTNIRRAFRQVLGRIIRKDMELVPPLVITKDNREEPIASMRLADFLDFARWVLVDDRSAASPTTSPEPALPNPRKDAE